MGGEVGGQERMDLGYSHRHWNLSHLFLARHVLRLLGLNDFDGLLQLFYILYTTTQFIIISSQEKNLWNTIYFQETYEPI